MSYTYLGKQNREEDLKKLDSAQCDRLCAEIRQELLERVTKNGGHLASNLGVVELTLAIHRVFSLPEDRLIFDVGHQSYVHKLLSDRFDRFSTLRQPGGLSGFQRRDESPYDPFGGGHASTSLSAAIGFAEADKLAGRSNYTICVVGDGAFTGGMIHEGLNNCRESLHLIIVLNENEMSISKNGGHFAGALLKMRTTGWYFNLKRRVKKVLSKTLFGQKVIRFSSRQKARIKRAIYDDNYFEQLGMNYLGPIDGHDREKLELIFKEAKRSEGCTVVHVKTVKGKGYEPAEKEPGKYHGIPPVGKTPAPTFSEHFGKTLASLGDRDEKICAITAAMADGTGLTAFEKAHPDRFFDVGIAEEHALTFSAALSAAGMKPVFAVYSTFLQRSFDQLIHDAALQRLPLTLCVDRAGLAPADGPTHHGVYDVAMALSLPETQIFAPLDFQALDRYLEEALQSERICFIRYRSGGESESARALSYLDEEKHLRGSLAQHPEGVILTYGALFEEALRAKNEAEKEGHRLSLLVLEMLRPDESLLSAVLPCLPKGVPLLFAEEGILNGGAGALWARLLAEKGRSVKILALSDPFVLAEKGKSMYESYGISAKQMREALGMPGDSSGNA